MAALRNHDEAGARDRLRHALVKRPVYPALSGRTMQFDGAGQCVEGC